MRSAELLQERAALIASARAFIDKANPTAEENAQFDAAMNRADELKAQADKLNKLAALDATLLNAREVLAADKKISRDEAGDQLASEKRVLTALFRNSSEKLSEAEVATFNEYRAGIRNAASTGTAGAGGITIAPGFQRELLIAMKAQGGMRAVSRSLPTDTGVALTWPTMDDRSRVATIIGENTQITADTDLAFSSLTLNSYTYKTGVLLVSLQILQDSAFDFDTLIRDAIAGSFVRGQNAHFTTGTGTGQPQGVTVGAPIGVTAATGGTVTATFDNVLDLIHSVDPVYRPGSSFMFHDTTLQTLRKIKDSTGRYLWQAQDSGVAGSPMADTIWGYPVVINQDMPVMAANALSIVYGDFSNYVIRDVLGIQLTVLRERYADYLQVGYLAFCRTDGRLATAAQPLKTFKNSAT